MEATSAKSMYFDFHDYIITVEYSMANVSFTCEGLESTPTRRMIYLTNKLTLPSYLWNVYNSGAILYFYFDVLLFGLETGHLFKIKTYSRDLIYWFKYWYYV